MKSESVKTFVIGLLALQVVAVALLWLLNAFSVQATAAFTFLLSADVVAFALVAQVYKSDKDDLARSGAPASPMGSQEVLAPPDGILALAVLQLASGVLLAIGGVILIAVAAFSISPLAVGAYGAIIVALGVATFVLGRGLLYGGRGVWWVEIMLYAIGIPFSILGLVLGLFIFVVPLMIDAAVLAYLTRPNVRAFFPEDGIAT